MSQPIKNVVLIGAGGTVGSNVLTALQAAGNFNVTVVSREGSKSTFPSDIKVVTVDPAAKEDALVDIFKGQDAVVDCAPLFDPNPQKERINAAAKAGVKRYIPSEFGSNTQEPRINEAMAPMFDSKNGIMELLKSKEKDGMSWTAIVTGPFYDFCLKLGILGFNIKEKKALIYDSGNQKFHTTILSSVGKSAAGVLAHPAETANKYIYTSSFNISQNEILSVLEKLTDSKFAVEHADTAESRKKGKELLAKGDFNGFAPALLGIELCGEEWTDVEKRYGLANDLLGLPSDTQLEEETAKVVKQVQ